MKREEWSQTVSGTALKNLFSRGSSRHSADLWVRIAAALAVAAVTGCTGNMHDLHQYVQQVDARKGGAIEPLPQIEPYQTFTYKDDGSRSPFTPSKDQVQGFADNGVHPDSNRPKQYLEQFPIDGLKMVGTLAINGVDYALIKDSNNIVTRIAQGDYMGRNDGKVVRISEAGINLREIIPNGLGGWTERQTQLPLTD